MSFKFMQRLPVAFQQPYYRPASSNVRKEYGPMFTDASNKVDLSRYQVCLPLRAPNITASISAKNVNNTSILFLDNAQYLNYNTVSLDKTESDDTRFFSKDPKTNALDIVIDEQVADFESEVIQSFANPININQVCDKLLIQPREDSTRNGYSIYNYYNNFGVWNWTRTNICNGKSVESCDLSENKQDTTVCTGLKDVIANCMEDAKTKREDVFENIRCKTDNWSPWWSPEESPDVGSYEAPTRPAYFGENAFLCKENTTNKTPALRNSTNTTEELDASSQTDVTVTNEFNLNEKCVRKVLENNELMKNMRIIFFSLVLKQVLLSLFAKHIHHLRGDVLKSSVSVSSSKLGAKNVEAPLLGHKHNLLTSAKRNSSRYVADKLANSKKDILANDPSQNEVRLKRIFGGDTDASTATEAENVMSDNLALNRQEFMKTIISIKKHLVETDVNQSTNDRALEDDTPESPTQITADILSSAKKLSHKRPSYNAALGNPPRPLLKRADKIMCEKMTRDSEKYLTNPIGKLTLTFSRDGAGNIDTGAPTVGVESVINCTKTSVRDDDDEMSTNNDTIGPSNKADMSHDLDLNPGIIKKSFSTDTTASKKSRGSKRSSKQEKDEPLRINPLKEKRSPRSGEDLLVVERPSWIPSKQSRVYEPYRPDSNVAPKHFSKKAKDKRMCEEMTNQSKDAQSKMRKQQRTHAGAAEHTRNLPSKLPSARPHEPKRPARNWSNLKQRVFVTEPKQPSWEHEAVEMYEDIYKEQCEPEMPLEPADMITVRNEKQKSSSQVPPLLK